LTLLAAVSLRLAIALVLALPLALGGGRVAAQQPGAAAPAALAARTDQAAAEAGRLERRSAQKLGEKRALERAYEAQLRELDRLKRSKASWRRDRQIRSSQAESQTTAERLSRADQELRAIDAQLRRQREVLLAAAGRELAAGPSPPRRALVERLRGQVSAALRPAVRKILVPDDTLDELADPDELSEQIALIAQAEAQLRGERERLRQREDRYARMARLRDVRERATQMGELEDEVVRRTGSRPERPSSGAQGDSAAPPPTLEGQNGTGSPGTGDTRGGTADGDGVGEDPGFEQSSILLTDVVDAGTIDALRRAGRSASPRARADAASRARKQVEARLQRFERSRALIQRHLTKLRLGQ
jgi:hypothetical protein